MFYLHCELFSSLLTLNRKKLLQLEILFIKRSIHCCILKLLDAEAQFCLSSVKFTFKSIILSIATYIIRCNQIESLNIMLLKSLNYNFPEISLPTRRTTPLKNTVRWSAENSRRSRCDTKREQTSAGRATGEGGGAGADRRRNTHVDPR